MVQELVQQGVAVEDQGAVCIFTGKKKKDAPLIIQKSDGGFGYATTDLAALKYRAHDCKAARIVYVTDAGQEEHFKKIFEAGETAKIIDPKVTKLDHMKFGLVLQETVTIEDGKEVKKQEKIKTRSGQSIKLSELLDEAKERAYKVFEERLK